MKPGPLLIRRCPFCLHFLRHEWWASGNMIGATLWSDGYANGPMTIRPELLKRCGACRSFLWVWDLPVEHEYRRSRQADWMLPAELLWPDREDLGLALREGQADTPERERWLRTELWYATNHPRRRRPRPPGRFFLHNLQRLQGLTEDPVQKAEMAREQGAFREALELLGDRQEGLAKAIRVRAESGDARVFELREERRAIILAFG
jgi:hypothetical protein